MPKTSKFRPYLAAAIVNLTCLAYGVAIGWMSPAAPALQSEPPPLGGDSALSDDTISWLGSLQFLGVIMGVFFWGQITEKYGRKVAGYLDAIPFMIGWAIIFFAQNDTWLLGGRCIIGLGGAGSLVLIPSYVSEISEDSYRGVLGSFIVLFFNLGVVIAYFIGSLVSLENLTIFCGSIPFVYLVCFYFLPESPVYLYANGKKQEARESLLWLRSGDLEVVEREMIVLDSLVSSSKSSVPISRLYDNKGTIKAMLISCATFFFQQFCGILTILTYTSLILIKSEIDFSPHTATVIIGLVQLIATWIASLIIDRIDRKILLIFQNLGMGFSLVVIGLFFFFQENTEENVLPNWTPFVFMCLHVITYSAGASMGYVITSEILLPEIRPLAFSIVLLWSAIMSFISVKIYKFLVDNIYMHGHFWFFAFWCLVSAVFTALYVPETRGKSLIEILKELSGAKVEKSHTTNKTEYTELPVREKNCVV